MAREQPCRSCGTLISLRRHSGLCAECYGKHCQKCKAALPAGKREPYCSACTRERHERRYRFPHRRCPGCRVALPPSRHNDYCVSCNRARSLAFRKARAERTDRTCLTCGVAIPGARSSVRCTPCERQFREAISRRPGKRCSFCGTAPPALGRVYCRPCHALMCAWRRASRRGDPAALLLGGPKPCPRSGP